LPGLAAESDALAISASIQARHMPFGTILDPIYASSSSNQITDYTRCGDSALWTGAYLAAESFRYYATKSPDAANNVQKALSGLKSLVDVTGNDLLARCIVPASSPFASSIESQESSNGVYQSLPNVWIGNTSRDEYVGAMFGLGVAYDYAVGGVRTAVSSVVTRMVTNLQNHGWTIVMPDGRGATTFLVRPEELRMVLQVAAHVNPAQFATTYINERNLLAPTLLIPVSVDIASNSSYFKFNLDYLSFYSLIRLDQANTLYHASYDIVRGTRLRIKTPSSTSSIAPSPARIQHAIRSSMLLQTVAEPAHAGFHCRSHKQSPSLWNRGLPARSCAIPPADRFPLAEGSVSVDGWWLRPG
jgi:hypothetical protein